MGTLGVVGFMVTQYYDNLDLLKTKPAIDSLFSESLNLDADVQKYLQSGLWIVALIVIPNIFAWIAKRAGNDKTLERSNKVEYEEVVTHLPDNNGPSIDGVNDATLIRSESDLEGEVVGSGLGSRKFSNPEDFERHCKDLHEDIFVQAQLAFEKRSELNKTNGVNKKKEGICAQLSSCFGRS